MDRQQTDVYLRIATRQRIGTDPRAVNVGRTFASLMVLDMQRTDRNPRAKDVGSYGRSPVGDKGHNEGSPTKEEVFTIFGGPHEAGGSRQACNRYAQEERHPT